MINGELIVDNFAGGGGAFYPGDEKRSYISYGLIVNAWKPLPTAYREVPA